jgi:hypothetical protein
LFLDIYGSSTYNGFKNSHSPEIAKEYFLKLLKSFGFAIKETIKIVDKEQLSSLNLIIKQGEVKIKKSKSFNDIDQIFIATQTKLIFQLIGHFPKTPNGERRINRKGVWELNGHRQIQYVQNLRNKELAIFGIIQDYNLFGDWGNFVSFYNSELGNDVEKLIEYMILNYPEKYKRLV